MAAGLGVLVAALLGAGLLALLVGQPGPGVPMLLGHLVAAIVALTLQRVADRRDDRVGRAASVGVLLVVVLVGLLFWWL